MMMREPGRPSSAVEQRGGAQRLRREVHREERVRRERRQPLGGPSQRGQLELDAEAHLGGLDEPLGRAALGLGAEPRERLGAEDLAGVQVEDGLVDDLQTDAGLGCRAVAVARQHGLDAPAGRAAALGPGLVGGLLLAHAGLEDGLVPVQLGVQRAGLEQVVDAQQQLGVAERLGQEVPGADGEGALAGRLGDVGGEHQDRHVAVGRDQRLDLGHHLEAVRGRHVEVEHQQVGLERHEPLDGQARVVDGLEVGVAGALEHAPEDHEVGVLVVDDEDPGVLGGDARRRCGAG